jgi:zinc protease
MRLGFWSAPLAALACFSSGLVAGLLSLSTIGHAQTAPIPVGAKAETAPATGLPEGMAYVQSVEGIHEYRLANGLQVLVLPDTSSPKITVNIVYRVGSRHEVYGATGMAHLLEHLVFKGTPRHPNIPQELKQHGAQFNGTTSFDRTNYFETFLATDDNLDWALDLEADRMVNSFIARKDLDSEMSVVRNEFEIGETNPGRVLSQAVSAAMFRWHNYGKSTIGSRSDIENVNIERLQGFYRRYYRPDNATLVVAGKFVMQPTLARIAKYFAPLPRPNSPIEPQYTVEPDQNGERSVTVRRAGDTQLVTVAYRIMSAQHSDTASMRVLTDLMGNAPNGRLHKRLVETGKATAASMGWMAGYDPGNANASAVLRKQDNPETVRDEIIKILEGLAAEPITEAEVNRAKAAHAAAFDAFRTNSQGLAVSLTNAIADGDWRLLFWERDQVAKVTAADVQRVALHYLRRDNRTVGMFVPTDKPERAEIPPRREASVVLKDYRGGKAVSQGEDFDPSQANIDKRTITVTLPKGLKLALLPKQSAGDRVQGQLSLQFGDFESLKGWGAAPSMVGALLNKGTRRLNSGAFSDELVRLKAQISISGGVNGVTANFSTTEDNLQAVLRLVAECLREPAFSDDEFNQIRRARLQTIEASLKNPQSAASSRLGLMFNAYDKEHPYYGGTPLEQRERLEAVTVDQVKKFHAEFYGASRGQLSVVGKFEPALVQTLTGELFGAWPTPKPYKRLGRAQAEPKGQGVSIEIADQANASFQAQHGFKMRDSDADFAPLLAANTIFGAGTMSSRLGTRLRQKEGLSYSAGSSVNVGITDDIASFAIAASYAPKGAAKLHAAVCEEVSRARKEGFTTEELASAKDSILSSRRINRSNDGALVGALASNLRYGRTMQWSAEFEDKLKAATLEQVNEAFRKYIEPARLVIVKAGTFGQDGHGAVEAAQPGCAP